MTTAVTLQWARIHLFIDAGLLSVSFANGMQATQGQLRAEELRSFLATETGLQLLNLGAVELNPDVEKGCRRVLGRQEYHQPGRRVNEIYLNAVQVHNDLSDKQKRRLASTDIRELIITQTKDRLMVDGLWKMDEASEPLKTPGEKMSWTPDEKAASRATHEQCVKMLLSIMLFHIEHPANRIAHKYALNWLEALESTPPPSPTRVPASPVMWRPRENPEFLAQQLLQTQREKQAENAINFAKLVKEGVGVRLVNLGSMPLTDEDLARHLNNKGNLRLRVQKKNDFSSNRHARNRCSEIYKTATHVVENLPDLSKERSKAQGLEKVVCERTIEELITGQAKSFWETDRQAVESLVPIMLFNLDNRPTAKCEAMDDNAAIASINWLRVRLRLPSFLTEHEAWLDNYLHCAFIGLTFNARPEIYTELTKWNVLELLGLKQFCYSPPEVRQTFQRRTAHIYRSALVALTQLQEADESFVRDLREEKKLILSATTALRAITEKTLAIMAQPAQADGTIPWTRIAIERKEIALHLIWILLECCRVATWEERVIVGGMTLPLECEEVADEWFCAWMDVQTDPESAPTLLADAVETPAAKAAPRRKKKLISSGCIAAPMRREQGWMDSMIMNPDGKRESIRVEEYCIETYKRQVESGARPPDELYTKDMLQYSNHDALANWEELVRCGKPTSPLRYFSVSLKAAKLSHHERMNEEQKSKADQLVEEIQDLEPKLDNWFNTLLREVTGTGISITAEKEGSSRDPITGARFPISTADIVHLHIIRYMPEGQKKSDAWDFMEGVYGRTSKLISLQQKLLDHLKASGDFKATIQEARDKWCKEHGVEPPEPPLEDGNDMTLWVALPPFFNNT